MFSLLYNKNISQQFEKDRQAKLYPYKDLPFSHAFCSAQNVSCLTKQEIYKDKRPCDKQKRIVRKRCRKIRPCKGENHSGNATARTFPSRKLIKQTRDPLPQAAHQQKIYKTDTQYYPVFDHRLRKPLLDFRTTDRQPLHSGYAAPYRILRFQARTVTGPNIKYWSSSFLPQPSRAFPPSYMTRKSRKFHR